MSDIAEGKMGVSVHSDGDGWAIVSIRQRVPMRVAKEIVGLVEREQAKAPPSPLRLVSNTDKD